MQLSAHIFKTLFLEISSRITSRRLCTKLLYTLTKIECTNKGLQECLFICCCCCFVCVCVKKLYPGNHVIYWRCWFDYENRTFIYGIQRKQPPRVRLLGQQKPHAIIKKIECVFPRKWDSIQVGPMAFQWSCESIGVSHKLGGSYGKMWSVISPVRWKEK